VNDGFPPLVPLFDYLEVAIPRVVYALESIAESLEKIVDEQRDEP
jgi:hypothetical protein